MEFRFIEPEMGQIDKKVRQRASYIRHSVTLQEKAVKATLYATALGIYKIWVNGQELDPQVLLPGFTNYNRRLQYQEYDVTDHFLAGENVLACVLADGWYRGSVGAFNNCNVFGEKTKFACTLRLEYGDGREEYLYTGADWKATQEGPLGENDLKLMEIYDATKEMPGWNRPGFDDSAWHPCQLSDYKGEMVPSLGEKILPHETFVPEILHTPNGETVLDFGQNLAGYVEFSVTGSAGTEVSLTMGEALDEDGNFTLKNLQGEGDGGKMSVGQKLTYILKEGKQSYRPFSLISGFRYAKVEHWPEEVRQENFRSVAVYSDLKQTGSFSCSNPLVNQLVMNVLWSEKSNFVDIPTDCPQRERAGWAGDINVFLETANYLTDTRKFIAKWMEDFTAAQKPSGALPFIIPEIPMIGVGDSSAGWSDAIAAIPMMQYQFYGDTKDLERGYEAAKKFVEFNRKRAKKKHISHIFRNGEKEQYLLDTGFHFGEWLEPGGNNLTDGLKAFVSPDSEVATAWFYYSSNLVSQMAEALGKEKDAAEYKDLAEHIRDAYRQEFLKDQTVDSPRQCKYVRPLYMGLVNEEEGKKIAADLNNLCIENEYKIGTGFLTTYQILNVLTDYGYVDTAYHMLEQEECPGWLYEVKQGATTMWEGWDAVSDSGLKPLSLNHYSPGAAISWLFSRCGGIRPLAPGFEKVQIRPYPGGSFTYAKAEYDSVKGKIVSDWKVEDGKFLLDVVIPEDVKAVVILPDGTKYENAVTGRYQCVL